MPAEQVETLGEAAGCGWPLQELPVPVTLSCYTLVLNTHPGTMCSTPVIACQGGHHEQAPPPRFSRQELAKKVPRAILMAVS